MKNLMRFAVVAIVAIATMESGFAQNQPLADGKPIKVKKEKLKGIDYRHEFRVGIGGGTMPRTLFTVTDTYPDLGYYTKHRYATPDALYFAYYGYRIVKGLKVTATFSYSNGYNDFYNNTYGSADEIVGGERYHYYRITPSIQYEWYNRGLVTFYSEVGCTFDFAYRSTNLRGVHSEGWGYPHGDGAMAVRFDVTPIGITVGKKLFGFAEVLSFGPRGFINAGIGYRFK